MFRVMSGYLENDVVENQTSIFRRTAARRDLRARFQVDHHAASLDRVTGIAVNPAEWGAGRYLQNSPTRWLTDGERPSGTKPTIRFLYQTYRLRRQGTLAGSGRTYFDIAPDGKRFISHQLLAGEP